jgi:hypothetical protein
MTGSSRGSCEVFPFNILNSNLEKVREYEVFSYIYFVHVIIDNL